MYINTEGKRYPKEIFKRLTQKEQSTFIEIDDKIYDKLLIQCEKESKYMLVLNGQVILKDIEVDPKEELFLEKRRLHSFLNKSNYIAINYGALRSEEKKLLFLADVSDTFEMTNEEIFDKRDEAIARINELKEIIKK